VSPTSSHRHQWLTSRLWAALNAEAAHGVRALEAVDVRVGPDRILIPDLVAIEEPDMRAHSSPTPPPCDSPSRS
jgi:hypothetical protein